MKKSGTDMGRRTYFVKNMVCEHCGQVLRQELENSGFDVKDMKLGEITFGEELNPQKEQRLNKIARSSGFEIIGDRNSQMVEQIKHEIIRIVHGEIELDDTLSEHLSARLHRDYSLISRLFSEVEGKSIERYFILQKIERAKELIVYGEQSLGEISYELGYSSQQHFSRQFKKETGLSPSHFKQIKVNKRVSIDDI